MRPTTRIPAGTTERKGRRSWRWQDAGGLAAPLAALALWALVVAGVATPLGAALARIDARRTPPAAWVARPVPCPPPPGALASAARPAGPGRPVDAPRCR